MSVFTSTHQHISYRNLGMKALADYVHALDLKFGVYSDAGLQTCAGRPGSLGYEVNDANSYASWGAGMACMACRCQL